MAARIVAAVTAAGLLLGAGTAQALTLTCRSTGGYERCAAETGDGVILQRTLGGSCAEGETWGFDPGGVWVDRGCAAQFAVGPQGAEPSALAQYGPAIGVLGAIAALGTVAALSGGNDGGGGGVDQQARREQAVALCTDYAGRIVKDAGGRGARLDRLKRTQRDGDRWRVEAYMEARWPNQNNPKKFTDCTVNFRGSNRVVAFRHDGLDQRPGGGGGSGGGEWGGGGGSGGGWGGGGGGSVRERAVLACQNEARRQGFAVRDVFDINEHRNRYDMVMLLEQRRERVYADCRYAVDQREARLGNVGRSAGRG